MGLHPPDRLNTGRAGGRAKGKGFNNIISMWPDGDDMDRHVEGP